MLSSVCILFFHFCWTCKEKKMKMHFPADPSPKVSVDYRSRRPPCSWLKLEMSWTLVCSATGSCGVILALFLSANGLFAAEHLLCILLNLAGGALLTAGSAGNAVESSEFIPFVVLNGVFVVVAVTALGRWCRRKLHGPPPPATSDPEVWSS